MTGVRHTLQQVDRFELLPNFPNPFNASTEISYCLPQAADICVTVYSVQGERVCELENGSRIAGEHRVRWQGLDDRGRAVASGVYFYRLEAISTSDRYVERGKMTLVR